jgi:hypothetical protein
MLPVFCIIRLIETKLKIKIVRFNFSDYYSESFVFNGKNDRDRDREIKIYVPKNDLRSVSSPSIEGKSWF